MTIFARYVFRQTASALVMILGSLSGMVWIALALKQLKIVTSNGQDALTLIQMTTLALPNLMGLVAPIALLISTIHVLNRLNGDSELIVLTASGANVWQVARPLLAMAAVVAVGVAVVNHVGMPWSLRLLREKIVEVRSDLLAQVLQPGRFSTPEPNISVHIRDRSLSGELGGVMFHDARKDNEVNSILAERGRLVEDDKGQVFLLMENGHIVRQQSVIGPADIVRFERYALDLESFQKKLDGPLVFKPKERYFADLAFPDPDDPIAKSQPGQLRAELHERLSGPLYPFTFVLIALAFVGQAQSTRTNRTQAIAAGFVVAALCRLGGMALNNVVAINALAVPLMYLLPIGAGGLAALAIWRNAWPRPGLTVNDRIGMAVEDAVSAVVRRWPWRRPAAQAGE